MYFSGKLVVGVEKQPEVDNFYVPSTLSHIFNENTVPPTTKVHTLETTIIPDQPLDVSKIKHTLNSEVSQFSKSNTVLNACVWDGDKNQFINKLIIDENTGYIDPEFAAAREAAFLANPIPTLDAEQANALRNENLQEPLPAHHLTQQQIEERNKEISSKMGAKLIGPDGKEIKGLSIDGVIPKHAGKYESNDPRVNII